MKLRSLILALLALFGGGCSFGKDAQVRLGGWVAYWSHEQGMQSVRSAKGSLADVFLFSLQLDTNGDPVLAPKVKELPATVASLKKQGATVWLTVVNDRPKITGAMQLKDAEILHAVMADPARRQKHIRRLVELCRISQVDGLDVDYENLNPADKELFSSFIAEIAKAVKAKGLALSVTVQPKFRESRSVGAGAADWAALGKVVDRLQIMLYNQHNARTAPGPVAEPVWIGKVLDYAASQCDPSKVVPVLKVSGYEWGPNPREVTFPEVEGRRKARKAAYEREPLGKAPFLTTRTGEESSIAYVEDALSLRAKIDFLRSKGFDKVVLWRLGVEDPAFWNPPQEPAQP